MPQFGDDPFRKVKAIGEAGQSVVNILAQATEAESKIKLSQLRTEGAALLANIMAPRRAPDGSIVQPTLLDPQVQRVAMKVAPFVGNDYIKMMADMAEQNRKATEPKGIPTDQNTWSYDTSSGTWKETKGTPKEGKVDLLTLLVDANNPASPTKDRSKAVVDDYFSRKNAENMSKGAKVNFWNNVEEALSSTMKDIILKTSDKTPEEQVNALKTNPVMQYMIGVLEKVKAMTPQANKEAEIKYTEDLWDRLRKRYKTKSNDDSTNPALPESTKQPMGTIAIPPNPWGKSTQTDIEIE